MSPGGLLGRLPLGTPTSAKLGIAFRVLYLDQPMRHIRRLTALLASLLSARVLWAGSGFACAMPSMPAAAHYPAVSMTGMDMSADMPGMEMPGATTQQSGDGATHHHTSCDAPSAPGDCESM